MGRLSDLGRKIRGRFRRKQIQDPPAGVEPIKTGPALEMPKDVILPPSLRDLHQRSGPRYIPPAGQVHLYMGIENLNLGAAQRATLIDQLKALGPGTDRQPARVNHWRLRLDGEAAIFESLFLKTNLSVDVFKQRLGFIFSVDPESIDHSTVVQSFAGGSTPVVTFSRAGTDYLRFALFGGLNATWAESGDECRGYLAAHAAEWETEE